MTESPQYEAGKCYRIKVAHQEGLITAKLVEVDEKASDLERTAQQQAEQKKFGMDMLNQGMKNLNMAGQMAGVPNVQMNNAIAGLMNIIQTQQNAAQGNPQLDSLDVEELKTRYEAAQQRLATARTQFDQALESRNQNRMGQAMTYSNQCRQEVLQLAIALEKKGVVMQQPQSQQPQCAQQEAIKILFSTSQLWLMPELRCFPS